GRAHLRGRRRRPVAERQEPDLLHTPILADDALADPRKSRGTPGRSPEAWSLLRLEALQQPGVDLRDSPLAQREVAVLGGEPRLHARDPLREPDPVPEGDEPVLLALPVQHRHADRAELESPRPDEGDVVVEPAVEALPDSVPDAVEDVGGEAAVLRHLDVGGPEQRLPHLDEVFRGDGRQLSAVAFEYLAMPLGSLEDGIDLLDVLLAHALGEVEALGVVGGKGC